MTYFEALVRTWENSPNIRDDGSVHASVPSGIFRERACTVYRVTYPSKRVFWDALRNATEDPITCLECLAL